MSTTGLWGYRGDNVVETDVPPGSIDCRVAMALARRARPRPVWILDGLEVTIVGAIAGQLEQRIRLR